MKILFYPHPALRHPAQPLNAIDSRIQSYVREMFELMYEGRGLGLAGPQVGLPYQIFIMNLRDDADQPPQPELARVYINPVILERKGSVEGEEGCLSFPGLFQKVRRARTIRYQAYNLEGQLVEGTAADLEARVWQHEVDHLHGELYIDKMGPIAKMASRSTLRSLERDYRRAQEKGEIPPDAEIEKVLVALAAGA
jgi:peptide deformylase